MTDDQNARFETALAAGAALAATAEPDARDRDVLDVDQLHGRPFFAAVEARAEDAARNRTSTWMLPQHEARTRTASIGAVDAAAKGLAREVTETVPGVRVAVLTGDEVLEAVMHNDRARLADRAGEQVATSPEAREGAGRAARSWTYNLDEAEQAGTAAAVTFPGQGDGDFWHLVFTGRASQDPNAKREARLESAMEETGQPLGTGFRLDAPTDQMLRATNDHEIGHVLSRALGMRGDDSPYATYLEENRADAFMVAMAVVRDGPDERVSQAYSDLRDTYAVAALDWDHWTTPTIRAARDHARDLHAQGQLQFMPADQVMRTFSGVAEANALSETDYHAFRGALYARTQDAEPPFAHTRTETGEAAASTALRGYMTARVRNATPERYSDRDAQHWRNEMALANPDHRRALELADPQTQVDASARRARFLAYMTPETTTERREFAQELNTLFSASRDLVTRDAAIASTESGGDTQAHQNAGRVLAHAERTAGRIAAKRSVDHADMHSLAQGLAVTGTAVKAAGPWMAAAAARIGDVERETRDAVATSRSATTQTRQPNRAAQVAGE